MGAYQLKRKQGVMGVDTNIAWTDHTFNPWWGCTKVSPGCDFCYAEAFDKRVGGAHWGKGQPRRTFGDEHWAQPLKWDRAAKAAGVKRKVFCASMADVMDDEAPEGQRDRLWQLIDATPNLIWQLLTKRPHRYSRYLPVGFAHNNVWLGTTTENQEFYDVRWPILCRVAISMGLKTFVSYEPAIGPLSIRQDDFVPHWLIFGGETGHGRRPMELAWAENIQRECRASGTKFFMKQFSASTPMRAAALIPAEMLIREFPAA
jgi:protein gp37